MQSGSVIGVCISKERGTGKTDIGHGYLKKDVGLVGDAHAGGERPVSVLAIECINDAVAGNGIKAKLGDFAENITLKGIDLKGVRLGTRLVLGEAEVEVTQIGKQLDASHTFHFTVGPCSFLKGVFAAWFAAVV